MTDNQSNIFAAARVFLCALLFEPPDGYRIVDGRSGVTRDFPGRGRPMGMPPPGMRPPGRP